MPSRIHLQEHPSKLNQRRVNRHIWHGWLLAALILLGAALRIGPLTDNRLHPDEALFATLARLIISGHDPMLNQTWLLVDKPPLFYYTLAGALSMCWGCELMARLPGLFASIISMALVAQVALTLWQSQIAALVAVLVFTLSPFAISFSPTVFADPQMVVWLLVSMLALSRRRWTLGGLFFGLAVATKENALFVLPVLVGVGITQSARRTGSAREIGIHLARFGATVLTVVTLMVVWDASRGGEVGFWNAAVSANNPGRVIRSGEVLPRIQAWWLWGTYFTGAGWLTALFAVLIGVLGAIEMRWSEQPRRSAVTLVLVAFTCGYIGFHWIVAFPVLDRYLLPLVPITALLVGRAADLMRVHVTRNWIGKFRVVMGIVVAGVVLVALAAGALRAMGSGYPIGGDHGAYDGIDTVSTYLRDLPDGTVVYHDSLGWTLGYYLFDSRVVPVSVSSPTALARDLDTFGEAGGDRYLILQGWNSHRELINAVQSVGYRTEKMVETQNRYLEPSFTIYHLIRVQ